jgi:phage terminase small subunit
MAKLNDKQKRFCEEYIIDLNGTQAATRAGYSPHTANVQSTYLLSNLNVKEYIQELIAKRSERTEITQDMVINEIAKVAMMNVEDFYDDIGLKPLSELSHAAKAGLASYQTKRIKVGKDEWADVPIMKVHDKMKALELLGRHVGAFEKDNKQKSTTVPVSIEFID